MLLACSILAVTLCWAASAARAGEMRAQEYFAASDGQTKIDLGRHPIIGYSVSVYVDGLLQANFVDYSCDAIAGTISFQRNLTSFDAIEVEYRYDPAVATLCNSRYNNPISVNLLNAKQGGVSASFANAGTGVTGRSALSTGLDAKLKTASGLSFATSTNYNPQSNLVASKLSVSDSLSRIISVSGNYTNNDNLVNPAASSTVSRIDAVIKPSVPLSLAASATTTTTPTGSAYLDSVAATLTESRSTKLTATVSDSTSSAVDTQTDSFSITTSPTPSVSVNSSLKLRDTTSDAPDASLDTFGAQATISVARPVKIIGTYCENPDDSGSPVALIRRGIGIVTTLGQISLTTNYVIDARTADSTDTPDSKFGVTGKVNLAHDTCLTGQYQDTTHFGYADRVRAYTVGLTHNVSGTLQLSLSGTINVDDSTTGSSATDTGANAAIGLKF